MIVGTFLAIAVLLAAILMLYFLRGWSISTRSVDESSAPSLAVDLDSLRNLVDPAEADYLRTHLPAREFRVLQRARNQAAIEYVRRIVRNAGILLRVGEAARHSPDPQTAHAAEKLVSTALELRFRSVSALVLLYARVWFPGFRLAPFRIIDQYETLRDRMEMLARVQRPHQNLA